MQEKVSDLNISVINLNIYNTYFVTIALLCSKASPNSLLTACSQIFVVVHIYVSTPVIGFYPIPTDQWPMYH